MQKKPQVVRVLEVVGLVDLVVEMSDGTYGRLSASGRDVIPLPLSRVAVSRGSREVYYPISWING